MKIQVLESGDVERRAGQLAGLFSGRAWPKGLYPYKALTTEEGWSSIVPDIQNDKVISFVAIDDGEKIIGHAAMVDHGWFWEGGRLAVDPCCQGKGAGHQLLEARINYAQNKGIKWFIVGSSYYQGVSERNCLRRGLVPLGVVPDLYTENGMSWGEVPCLWVTDGFQIRLDNSMQSESLLHLYPEVFASGGNEIPTIGNGRVCALRPGREGWEFLRRESLAQIVIDSPKGKIVRGVSAIHTTETNLKLLRAWDW